MILSNIFELIKINSNKEYLIKADGSVQTYGNLETTAGNIAELARLRGVKQGCVAGLMLSEPALYVPSLLGCWSLGATAAVIEPSTSKDKLELIRSICNLEFILTDTENPEQIKGIKCVNIKDARQDVKPFSQSHYPIDDNFPALLLFTSGSTGTPKCVPLSLKNIEANIKAFNSILNIGANDVFICSSPLFYAHGLYNSFLTALFLGARVVYGGVMNLTNTDNFLKLSNKYLATVYHTTPAMMQILIMIGKKTKENLPQFKRIIAGTSRLEPSLKKEFEGLFKQKVTQQYGMTETLFITVNAFKQLEIPDSVGIPVACKLKITDENGNELATGENGNIAVKSESSFGSYYNQTEETKNSYVDSWFYTGDVGFLDPDGNLMITGRKKEIIKKGGFNISPFEIDSAIMKIKGVAESATVGLPDKIYGEEIYTVAAATALSENEILKECRKTLPRSHIPKRVFIVSQLPKTSSGKVARQDVRIMVEKLLGNLNN